MNTQSRHSIHCSYTQSMNVDEDSKAKFKHLSLLDMSSRVFNRGYSVLHNNNNAISTEKSHQLAHGRIQRGDRGSGSPLKNLKNIGFPSNIDPDPLKITKLPSQHSMVGHYRHASERPCQWRFTGGSMMAHF